MMYFKQLFSLLSPVMRIYNRHIWMLFFEYNNYLQTRSADVFYPVPNSSAAPEDATLVFMML